MTLPLTDNPEWKFTQPKMLLRASYTAVNLSGAGAVTTQRVATEDNCRETVIYNTRQLLRKALCDETTHASEGWNKSYVVARKIRFGSEVPTGKEINQIGIRPLDHDDWNDQKYLQLIQVADYIVGPVCVLLDPSRPKGDWWKTPKDCPEDELYKNYRKWNGTTNWFLVHPVGIALITGLYRQCYHLINAGLGDKVIEGASADEVEEVLTGANQKKALALTKKMRAWIEVPEGLNGQRNNYAFPLRTWRTLIRLQRAIRHHSYEEAFDQPFAEGWMLDPTVGQSWHGAFQFWGDEDGRTTKYEHLMELGKPRRISARVKK